jgi:hypothetical protein
MGRLSATTTRKYSEKSKKDCARERPGGSEGSIEGRQGEAMQVRCVRRECEARMRANKEAMRSDPTRLSQPRFPSPSCAPVLRLRLSATAPALTLRLTLRRVAGPALRLSSPPAVSGCTVSGSRSLVPVVGSPIQSGSRRTRDTIPAR